MTSMTPLAWFAALLIVLACVLMIMIMVTAVKMTVRQMRFMKRLNDEFEKQSESRRKIGRIG